MWPQRPPDGRPRQGRGSVRGDPFHALWIDAHVTQLQATCASSPALLAPRPGECPTQATPQGVAKRDGVPYRAAVLLACAPSRWSSFPPVLGGLSHPTMHSADLESEGAGRRTTPVHPPHPRLRGAHPPRCAVPMARRGGTHLTGRRVTHARARWHHGSQDAHASPVAASWREPIAAQRTPKHRACR